MSISIRNCTFVFKCDRQWSLLKKTSLPNVRFCEDCEREVFYCETDQQLAESVALNRCVAIQVENHLRSGQGPLMGSVDLGDAPEF